MVLLELGLEAPNILRLTAKGSLVLVTTLTDREQVDPFLEPAVYLRDDLVPNFDNENRWGSTTSLKSIRIRLQQLMTEEGERTLSDWLEFCDEDRDGWPIRDETTYDMWEFVSFCHPSYVHVEEGDDIEAAIQASMEANKLDRIDPILSRLDREGLISRTDHSFQLDFEEPGGMIHMRVPDLPFFQWKTMFLPPRETDEAMAAVLDPFQDLHDQPEFSLRLLGLDLEQY